MSPEGTRRPVDRWRSGFYRIALGANLPIVAGYFDNAGKRAGFGPVFHPTGNTRAEIEEMRAYYTGLARR
jgi:hypothetical protein